MEIDRGVLPGYPLEPRIVQHDSGLWRRVLTHAGVVNPATGSPYSESMLTGLAGGIGFMVFTFEYASITTATVVTRAHPEPFTSTLLARCGASIDELTTGSAARASASLDAALARGRAVMIRPIAGKLPWIASDDIMHIDSIDVAVIGRDPETGAYLIDDGSGEIRRADPEALAAARVSRTKDKHWQASVQGPGTLTRDALADRVRDAVIQSTGRMLGTAPLAGIPAHFATNFGVAGMRTWSDRLRDAKTKKGWTAMFANEERLRTGLGMVQEFLVSSRWGGDGALRGQYADFLVESSELPGLARLANAAPEYRDLAAQWKALAAAVDPGVAANARAAHFSDLSDMIDDLADGEEAAARVLADCTGS